MSPAQADLAGQLIGIAQASPWLMSALRAVRGLGLDSWCIGAGAVRTVVWDALHGLDDLFSMTIRHNPARASVENYRQRVAGKRYTERWPKVRVVPA